MCCLLYENKDITHSESHLDSLLQLKPKPKICSDSEMANLALKIYYVVVQFLSFSTVEETKLHDNTRMLAFTHCEF